MQTTEELGGCGKGGLYVNQDRESQLIYPLFFSGSGCFEKCHCIVSAEVCAIERHTVSGITGHSFSRKVVCLCLLYFMLSFKLCASLITVDLLNHRGKLSIYTANRWAALSMVVISQSWTRTYCYHCFIWGTVWTRRIINTANACTVHGIYILCMNLAMSNIKKKVLKKNILKSSPGCLELSV